ncbi:glycosyltransferase family 4 protein [Polyangium aurulentum]|uniref:glycosyltransferase family 4 protein n=1 Tax=Polyangium aurulentum TaxID=2567896 RepID=UPI0010AE7ADD|nr:glycosyltransferase family 4 protein [Polyangium aurulentum]UQA62389.1 glycosyltransferase family 4 protein [Polyangium aurulentum]
MKLLLLLPDLINAPHSGIPTVGRQALREIERRAAEARVPLEIEVWALHDREATADDLARTLGLIAPPRRYRTFAGSRAAMLAAAATTRARADLVFTTHIALGPVARLLKGPRTRLVQFIHGIECWRRLPVHHRVGLAATDALLSNSAFTLARFIDYNPAVRRIPSRVCWLGAPADRATTEAPSRAENKGLSALIVGRMCGEERYKGHEELIAVWSQVRRACPEARLDVVGDGNARRALEVQAERLGLVGSGAVRFWGRVSDAELRARYEAASVFAMPSRGEGFGLVYLEAMAFGLPCVASLDDAAREVIAGGETGLLVRYGDREALARALIDLFTDEDKRARLGRAGRERMQAHFTEEHFGARLWAALGDFAPSLRAAGAA